MLDLLGRIRPQVLLGMLIVGVLGWVNPEVTEMAVVGIAATMNLLVKPNE